LLTAHSVIGEFATKRNLKSDLPATLLTSKGEGAKTLKQALQDPTGRMLENICCGSQKLVCAVLLL
jgi:hypothetical protein